MKHNTYLKRAQEQPKQMPYDVFGGGGGINGETGQPKPHQTFPYFMCAFILTIIYLFFFSLFHVSFFNGFTFLVSTQFCFL